MKRIETFRDHCRSMSTAEHKPDCPSLTAKEPPWPPGGWVPRCDEKGVPTSLVWLGPKPKWEPPKCDGCLTDDDRALFARLAGEVDAYMDGTLFEEAQ